MQLEYSTIIIPLDDHQQEALDAKAREGWQAIPGVHPIGVWMVCRPMQQPMVQNAGIGKLTIDESKIFILRDGKLIDKDGNVVAPETVR